MSKTQCFVIKKGTAYDKDIKKHYELESKWAGVFPRLQILLDEHITRIAFDPKWLTLDISELEKEDNKKLFKLNGELKANSKKAKTILIEYKKIITELGLAEFYPIQHLNFSYGVMRNSEHQTIESFRTSENDVYFKANFDLEKKSNGMVVPISEIEYTEKYLAEMKKREG